MVLHASRDGASVAPGAADVRASTGRTMLTPEGLFRGAAFWTWLAEGCRHAFPGERTTVLVLCGLPVLLAGRRVLRRKHVVCGYRASDHPPHVPGVVYSCAAVDALIVSGFQYGLPTIGLACASGK